MAVFQGFWEKVPTPAVVLAPMADVTDAAFRRMFAKYGKPDVTWTEFVSVNGLLSPGKNILLRDLLYSEGERPIVAQIFGGDPELFYDVAQLCVELGFDGIDLNMGCPDRNVEKQGGGSSLIKDPIRAQRIIARTIAGAEVNGKRIPVSVKTRVGYNKVELEEWFPLILELEPAVLTVHARTRKEMSKVPARWEHVARAVELRNQYSPHTKIFGNGDIRSKEEGIAMAKQFGADGAMVGRGVFGNPWFFGSHTPTLRERVDALIEHMTLFDTLLGDLKSFAIMKKHVKAYLRDFDGAKELRLALMETQTKDDAILLLGRFKESLDTV